MTRIKFCGITRPEDAARAQTLGATHVGAILCESPRRIQPEDARIMFDAAPSLRHVAVFRRSPIATVLHDARISGADVLQLHGHFSVDEITQLREAFDGEIWTVIPVEIRQAGISEDWDHLADLTDAALLDTSAQGHTGGTGIAFDWVASKDIVAQVALRTTVVLAGGLNAGNVGEAIRILSPDIVDVSSGVESAPGVKDPKLMQAFADAVRSASMV